MGHTNSTANLALPQFVGSDKPTWLGDINGAFSDIDAYVGTNDAAVAAAASDASSAISQASAAVSTATNANTTAGNASTVANNAIGVANNAVAIAGVVDSKVGLLADLNTTDKTSIVNAINEVNAKPAITKTVTADGVKTYAQILGEFVSEIDNLKADSVFEINIGTSTSFMQIVSKTASSAEFSKTVFRNTAWYASDVIIATSGSYYEGTNGTQTDNSSSVVPSGYVFNLYA